MTKRACVPASPDKTELTLAVLAHPCDVHGSTSVAGGGDAESGLPDAEFLLHKGYEAHGIKRRASLLNTRPCVAVLAKKGFASFCNLIH